MFAPSLYWAKDSNGLNPSTDTLPRVCRVSHSMTHWVLADNYTTVRHIRIISSSVTETRMKTAVKTPSRKTNNQGSFGGSLLKNNMEVEAATELAVQPLQRHLDEIGVHRVCTIYVGGF